MCGIAGFVGAGSADDLSRMVAALHHRGPDDRGILLDESTRVYLATARLAVVDLVGGRQPMRDSDGRLAVVFNGEIYNHLDLRRQLEASGCRFTTDHSDTEVLLHAYRHWGDEFLLRLNGMFAFAIFDPDRSRILIARDRFGEKPLYYAAYRDGIAFTSELAALGAHGAVRTEIDPMALRKYFAYGFFPSPYTVYKGIRKLPPGHLLVVDTRNLEASSRRYWRYAIEPADEARSEAGLVDELRDRLATAVRRRLMSDVPIGVFLSGGIDSSAIAAFAAQQVGAGTLETFCLGFDEPSYDESGFARQVATHLSSRHHERRLGLAEAFAELPTLLARLDEPLGDPSILPTYLLCRFARERVTVALGGDGGDELFAGYDPFAALGAARLYGSLVPRPVHRMLRAGIERIAPSSSYMALDFRLRRTLRGLSYAPALWNPVWLGPLEPDEIGDLLHQVVDAEDLYSEAIAAWTEAGSDCDIDRSLEFYANFYLPEAVLTKADRASMMVSLEYRAPFLDIDLVEFARRLPARMKLRKGSRKYLLRKAMAGLLPDRILTRPKQGFGIPLLAALEAMQETIAGLRPAGLDPAVVETLRRQHHRGKDQRLFLWCLLALSMFAGRVAQRA